VAKRGLPLWSFKVTKKERPLLDGDWWGTIVREGERLPGGKSSAISLPESGVGPARRRSAAQAMTRMKYLPQAEQLIDYSPSIYFFSLYDEEKTKTTLRSAMEGRGQDECDVYI
jgi:hypothetical protein